MDYINKDGLPRVTDPTTLHTRSRDALILEFMGDALRQKWRHVRNNPTKGDDIHSVALLALVEAVDWWIVHRKDDNLSSVVCHFVNLQIRDYLLYDHTVRCPKSQKKKPVIVSATLHDNNGQCYEDFTLNYQKVTTQTPDSKMAYEELIQNMGLSYRQRTILDLRIKGYTFREIGSVLRLSPTRVYEILEQIAERYTRVNNG